MCIIVDVLWSAGNLSYQAFMMSDINRIQFRNQTKYHHYRNRYAIVKVDFASFRGDVILQNNIKARGLVVTCVHIGLLSVMSEEMELPKANWGRALSQFQPSLLIKAAARHGSEYIR